MSMFKSILSPGLATFAEFTFKVPGNVIKSCALSGLFTQFLGFFLFQAEIDYKVLKILNFNINSVALVRY